MTLDEEIRITKLSWRAVRAIRQDVNTIRRRIGNDPVDYPNDRWDDANASHNQ